MRSTRAKLMVVFCRVKQMLARRKGAYIATDGRELAGNV